MSEFQVNIQKIKELITVCLNEEHGKGNATFEINAVNKKEDKFHVNCYVKINDKEFEGDFNVCLSYCRAIQTY